MSENELISIIVPVYNVEQYIQRCINSVLSQTYKNFELLLINDGSTDLSGKICENNQMRDERIHMFVKSNGGLSDARNYGLDRAKGKYIVFLDSDDYIGKDFVEILYRECKEQNAELAIGSTEIVYGQKLEYVMAKKKVHNIYNATETMKIMCINSKFGVSAWGKLFKRELFIGKRFPKNQLYEDLQVIPYLLEKCSKIVYCSDAKMYWCQRQDSITHSYNKKHLEWFDAAEQFVNYVDEYYPNLHEYAICRYVNDSFWAIVQRMVLTDEAYDCLIYAKKRSKKYWISGICNHFLNLKKKINVVLVLVSPRCYIYVYRIYWRIFKRM